MFLKKYVILEFGEINSSEWISNLNLVSSSYNYRYIMKDPKNFESKYEEFRMFLERNFDKNSLSLIDFESPDVFLSYCWKNSPQAQTGDPSNLSKFLMSFT